MVVYPDAVWYRVRTEADVNRILDEHIAQDRIVEELRMDTACLPIVRARAERRETTGQK